LFPSKWRSWDELQEFEQVKDEFKALVFALFFSYNDLNNELGCEEYRLNNQDMVIEQLN
jgi:hypothetical protein